MGVYLEGSCSALQRAAGFPWQVSTPNRTRPEGSFHCSETASSVGPSREKRASKPGHSCAVSICSSALEDLPPHVGGGDLSWS